MYEGPRRIVGVLTKTSKEWRLQSIDRRERGEYIVHAKPRFELKQGDLAVAETLPPRAPRGLGEARLIEILGDKDQPHAISLVAIATHELPHYFNKATRDEADAAKPVTLEGRVDLREIPLVTIDGADARDFDDAVFAEPHGDGWHLIVAIADVAHYVRAGSALDKAAYDRGNSVYFPDRVVPMLPEALSNELCSLKPHVDRACLAVHLWLDKRGELAEWKFVRGVMRSHARLTYEQIQKAMDGDPDQITAPLLDKVIKSLYGAYERLDRARAFRGTLDLNIPERKVEIGKDGKVVSIKIRERLASHKLIEEFMITANVAAAKHLGSKGGYALYRVHDRPGEEALRDFLESFEINLVPSRDLRPHHLTKILLDFADSPYADLINEMMLRTQAKAVYSKDNIGHFGLALNQYTHFTSPIRRYADLIVHRALIRADRLGDDGITDSEIARLEPISDHISMTERRAAAAERDAVDRFCALYLTDKVGTIFAARISGATKKGLFVRLNETGAEGHIPFEQLPDDLYMHDEKRQALVGKHTGRTYTLAQRVHVRMEDNDSLTGRISFSIVEENHGNEKRPAASHKSQRKRDEKHRPRRRTHNHHHG